jgi:hypothetical protein
LLRQEQPMPPKMTDKRPSDAVQPNRRGKRHVGAYLHSDFSRRLLLVRAQTGKTGQALLEEALNGLFCAHKVPPVTED